MQKNKKGIGRARGIRAGKHRQKRNYKQNKTGMFLISCMVLVLVGVMSTQIVRMCHQKEDLIVEEAQKISELEAEQERQKEIQNYATYVTTPEYLEQLAKTKLGLVYPNEIVFKEQKREP